MKLVKFAFLFITFGCHQLSAQTPERAAERLNDFVERMPEFAPGYALIAVTSKKVLLCKTARVLRAGVRAKLTKSTPFYVASQTKSYIGLLAASLHDKGILRLDDKISDHWPDIRLPKGDSSSVQLADLLNHVVPFEVGYITLFEKNIGEIRPDLYPFVIEKHATSKANDFKYDNYGYNIWAAILENATGKSWQTWLQEMVIEELELNDTHTKHSQLDPTCLPWRHVWRGKEQGWLALPPKTDPTMHSAGGVSTSASDQAIWLQAHLRSQASRRTILTPAVYKTAHRSGTGNRKLPRKYEFDRLGYSLGWNVCKIDGKKWHIHGGGLTGVRSISAFRKNWILGSHSLLLQTMLQPG